MSPHEIADELERLAAKGTARGPWKVTNAGLGIEGTPDAQSDFDPVVIAGCKGGKGGLHFPSYGIYSHPGRKEGEANAALIVAMRNHLPEIIAALREVDELNRVFDMAWNANRRATKRWQDAHPGNDNVWPDRADMVVWLMDQHEAALRQPRADEETVERVARAMATSDGTVWEERSETPYNADAVYLTELGRNKFRAFARAAIKAMAP